MPCVGRVWPKPCPHLREAQTLFQHWFWHTRKKIMAFSFSLSFQQHHHYSCSSNFSLGGWSVLGYKHKTRSDWIAFSPVIPTRQLRLRSCSCAWSSLPGVVAARRHLPWSFTARPSWMLRMGEPKGNWTFWRVFHLLLVLGGVHVQRLAFLCLGAISETSQTTLEKKKKL